MASDYKTPGVYIEEIPKFPPSIAQVETAIPAFIGYTAKAERRGENLTNKPVRIGSLLEFVEIFGGDKTPATINVKVDDTNNYAVTEVTMLNTERYYMYDSLRLFYDNGGGDCYIVSVGKHGTTPVAGDENTNAPGLRVGIKALEKADEPTILLCPDACRMKVDGTDDPGFYSLQQMMLEQCARLQDRVGLFDLKENISSGFNAAVENFRNNIGINNLKYGAVYGPWVQSTFQREVDFNAFLNNVTKSGGGAVDLKTISPDPTINALVTNAIAANDEIVKVVAVIDKIRKAGANGDLTPAGTTAPSIRDKFNELKQAVDGAANAAASKTAAIALMNFCRNALLEFQSLKTSLSTSNLLNDLNSYATSESLWRGNAKAAISIDANANTDDWTTPDLVNTAFPSIDPLWLGAATPSVIPASTKVYTGTDVEKGRAIALDLQVAFEKLSAFADTILAAAKSYKQSAQTALYERHPVIGNIVNHIKKEWNTVPASGAIAGVYARVDRTRGVWKAPANESLNSVLAPAFNISHDEQARLNVDVVAGKSVNAIRSFTGKGTLVWGARTLAGNDNEWRYVSVRRFFNMVEESTKKATEQFVFEPNDANTWIRVQAMIENFLTVLWRAGALQGAKPEHAFYVAVGLGKTMTALDILEGRMIVEIGMAAVRPAEFIILKFSHKMAES